MPRGMANEDLPPAPGIHFARGLGFWMAASAIFWTTETLLRFSFGDPPAGPGRLGLTCLFIYLLAGFAGGLGASLLTLPHLLFCRRWQRPFRGSAQQAAVFIFVIYALFRMPLSSAGTRANTESLFLIPFWVESILLNIGWLLFSVFIALSSYWIILRPLAGPQSRGSSPRVLAAIPLLLTFGAVLLSTSSWEGPVSAMIFPAFLWGIAISATLGILGGAIQKLQRWRRDSLENMSGSGFSSFVSVLLVVLFTLSAVHLMPRPRDPAQVLGRETRQSPDHPKPNNILLITVDTLRADHLSSYNYPRPTSPSIDRLAQEGILFEQAVCPLPRTIPSLASMLTGLYPQDHGFRDNYSSTLVEGIKILPERLREAGFHTAALNANGLVHPTTGLSQGFDYYYVPAGDTWINPYLRALYERFISPSSIPSDRASNAHFEHADSIAARARTLMTILSQLPEGERFFLWIHFYDPHMNYSPPPPYHLKFGRSYRGPYRKSFHYGLVSKGYMTFRCDLPETDMSRAVELYDGEILFTDHAVGSLMDMLERYGLEKNTVTIFSSDHGESLGEHRFFFDHGDLLYDPSMRIPLIVRFPGGRLGGRRIEKQVTLMDITPTILELAGLPLPAIFSSGYSGRSLSPLLEGLPTDDFRERPAFGESGHCFYPWLNDRLLVKPPPRTSAAEKEQDDVTRRFGRDSLDGRLRMIRHEGWKLILTPTPDGADRLELYNLIEDPEELHDLSEEHPERTVEMLAALRVWMESDPGAPTGTEEEISEGTLDRLRALGYLQ